MGNLKWWQEALIILALALLSAIGLVLLFLTPPIQF